MGPSAGEAAVVTSDISAAGSAGRRRCGGSGFGSRAVRDVALPGQGRGQVASR